MGEKEHDDDDEEMFVLELWHVRWCILKFRDSAASFTYSHE
jgi:hypothetical protein